MTEDHKAYIVFHKARNESVVHADDGNSYTVFHDGFGNHNQDPFIFTKQFIYSYCHITQLKPLNKGDIVFFANVPNENGQSYEISSAIKKVICDLVFVVDHSQKWENSHTPPKNLSISKDALQYNLLMWTDHIFRRRYRATYIADPEQSFQPKTAQDRLFNIYNLMNDSLKENLATNLKIAGVLPQPLRITNNDDAKDLKCRLMHMDNRHYYTKNAQKPQRLTGNVLECLYDTNNLTKKQPTLDKQKAKCLSKKKH